MTEKSPPWRNAHEDARDRLMLSISDALIELLRSVPHADRSPAPGQIAHNLTGCSKDLLDVSGIGHGRPSGWRNLINN